MKLCGYGDCMNTRKWDGYCTTHREHMEKYGRCFPTRSYGKVKEWRGCDTPGCNGVHKGNGLCGRCYIADYRKRKATAVV
ncbi:hypothetical protein GCM10018965_083970 [Nonomuraea roseola]